MEKRFLKGFSLDAETVQNMKDATVLIKSARYDTMRDFNNPDKEIEKLVLLVETKDGQELDYYPNKTSQDTIAKKVLKTFDLNEWEGKTLRLYTEILLVGKDKRPVIFVSEDL